MNDPYRAPVRIRLNDDPDAGVFERPASALVAERRAATARWPRPPKGWFGLVRFMQGPGYEGPMDLSTARPRLIDAGFRALLQAVAGTEVLLLGVLGCGGWFGGALISLLVLQTLLAWLLAREVARTSPAWRGAAGRLFLTYAFPIGALLLAAETLARRQFVRNGSLWYVADDAQAWLDDLYASGVAALRQDLDTLERTNLQPVEAACETLGRYREDGMRGCLDAKGCARIETILDRSRDRIASTFAGLRGELDTLAGLATAASALAAGTDPDDEDLLAAEAAVAAAYAELARNTAKARRYRDPEQQEAERALLLRCDGPSAPQPPDPL